MNKKWIAALVTGCLAGEGSAQGLVPLVPFESTADVYTCDSSADKLYGFADLNLDGDFADFLEAWVFYDDALGPHVLSNPSGMAIGNGGRFYVADRSTGQVLRFIDLDGDRTAHGPGEAIVFFDGDPLVNLSGLQVDQPVRPLVDDSEVVWLAESNAGGAGADAIVRLVDLDFDGDANDLGEATRYFEPPPGALAGDTQIMDAFIGDDGHLYYVESSSTGFRPQGIYRLDDADGNGTIDPLTEVALWFTMPAAPNPSFLQSAARGVDGYVFLTDTGNDLVLRIRDENADGDADDPGEFTVFFAAPMPAIYWDVSPLADGRVLVCGENGVGRLLMLDDANGDGTVTAAEQQAVFVAPDGTFMPNPRSLVAEPRPLLDVPATLAIGTTGAGLLMAGSSDVIAVYYGLAKLPAPLPLAPHGFLEVDVAAPFFLHVSGLSTIAGSFAFPITVPASPALSGLVLHWQAVAGKADRTLLSNLQTLLIP